MNKNTISNNKRAVIYCRVSTKEQVEEGNSLATQERHCREYALKYGYEIAQTFIEQGESAKTANRTELQKLFSFCANRKNRIQAIIAYKIDRISRNTDDYSQIRMNLKRYGVEIKSTSEYFENTPAGRFMENIIANVAQFDNDVRTERSVGGMRDAVREGRYVWQAPVGYINQKIEGKANIVPNEKAPLVRKAFEILADGFYSADQVRTQMALLGLGKNGKPFARSYFYRLVKNELYAGWINKFGERHQGTFEPLISEELYQRVQRILQRKKIVSHYVIQNPSFPLRRFIAHPNGEKLTGGWSQGRHKKYPYYRFSKARLQWRAEKLEESFLFFVNSYAFSEHLYELLKNNIRDHLIMTSEKKKEDRELLIQQQKDLKQKQNVIVQKSVTGVLSDSVVKEQMSVLEDELWSINRSIEAIHGRTVNFGKIVDDLHEFFINPAVTWQKLPYKIKERLLWFKFPKGITYDGTTFRTVEICSIFKLKDLFLAKESSNVPHRGQHFEHPILANSPALGKKQKRVQWKVVGEDLVLLHDIVFDTKPPPEDTLPSAQLWPKKEAG